jgi:hypothetical protein
MSRMGSPNGQKSFALEELIKWIEFISDLKFTAGSCWLNSLSTQATNYWGGR